MLVFRSAVGIQVSKQLPRAQGMLAWWPWVFLSAHSFAAAFPASQFASMPWQCLGYIPAFQPAVLLPTFPPLLTGLRITTAQGTHSTGKVFE